MCGGRGSGCVVVGVVVCGGSGSGCVVVGVVGVWW